MKKKFVKIAYDIRYYGEGQLRWWQKIFYSPPRKFISSEYRTSRNKAETIPVPAYVQFGNTFGVSAYRFYVEMMI